MKKLILLFSIFVSFAASASSQKNAFLFFAGKIGSGGGGGSSSGVDTLARGTITNQATAVISFASWYNTYSSIEIIYYDLVPATSGQGLQMQLSANNSTFDAASGNYSSIWGTNGAFSPGASGTSTSIVLLTNIGGGIVTGTGLTSNGHIFIDNPGSSGDYPKVYGYLIMADPIAITFTGTRKNQQVTQALDLFMDSGNISLKYVIVGTR
jgi:hypothetical protein